MITSLKRKHYQMDFLGLLATNIDHIFLQRLATFRDIVATCFQSVARNIVWVLLEI